MSLLWWSGLRRSEICNLDLAGVDLHHGTATVGSRTFSTKNNKVRRVPLAGETVAALDRYLRRRGVEDGPLFLSSRGDDHEDRRLQPNSITTMVNYRAQRAGIDRRIGIHEFRRATGNRRSGLPRSATSRRPPPPRTLRRARRGCLGPGPGRDLRRCCASSPLAPRGCGTSAAPGQPTSSHAHHIPQRAPRRSASVPPLASAIKVTPRFIYPQPLNTTERG